MGNPHRAPRGLLSRTWKQRLALIADLITVKDWLFGLAVAGTAFVGFGNAVHEPSPQLQQPPATVSAAIDGICSRETLIKTTEDGTFQRIGVEHALKIKRICQDELRDEYLRRGRPYAT
jgi:hypothetical protein